MVSPPAAPDDIPPTPTRRGAAAALLAGSAALMALLLVLDLYGMLPAELLAPVAPFGPPAQVTVVIAVLVEGLVAAFLVSSGRHPLDAPFINHYGTRTAAAGGVLLTAGIVAFLVWETALRFFWGDAQVVMESSVVAIIVGAAVLLSGLTVLASTLVAPWITRHAE